MKKFTILIPVFNDWKSVLKLLEEIDLEIIDWNAEISVLIINDASTEEALKMNFNFKKIKSVCIIDMKKNQGHARCNATGLKYLVEKENFDYVINLSGYIDHSNKIKTLRSHYQGSKNLVDFFLV